MNSLLIPDEQVHQQWHDNAQLHRLVQIQVIIIYENLKKYDMMWHLSPAFHDIAYEKYTH